MRTSLIAFLTLTFALLTGCASAPNTPSLTLATSKSPEQFTECVMPKLQEQSMEPTVTQAQRHYRIVVSSAIAADNVIEAYKAADGGKVFIYERSLLAFGLKQAAQECA